MVTVIQVKNLFLLCLLCPWFLFADAVELQVAKLDATIGATLDAIYAEKTEALSNLEKEARVRAVLEENYDLSVLIRRAIGRNWNRLNSDEQAELLELVKQLVVSAYVGNMKRFSRPEVSFEDPIVISQRRMEIPSTVTSEDVSVSVLYRLGRLESGWQVYDIVAEDISLVANYRQQIDDHFRKKSAQELIARLKEILKKKEIRDASLP